MILIDEMLTNSESLKTRIEHGDDPMITSNPHVPLKTNHHYTDNSYTDPENIFGRIERHLYLAAGCKITKNNFYAGVEGAGYNYSDRLYSWFGNERYRRAVAYADTFFPRKCASWYELLLSAILMKIVNLVHIVVGIDGGGYAYQVFGYTTQE